MSHRLYRAVAAVLLFCLAACGFADQLQAFPVMSLADGRSTATITAMVLDTSGRPVPDGSRVFFTTTLGSFREALVTTLNGMARAILVSSSTPGIATITATPLTGGAGPSTMQYEFVGDRSLLSSAREFIEVVAPSTMTYTVDTKIIGAFGQPATPGHPEKKVAIRYREIKVDADQVQLNIRTYELRARNATLVIGKTTFPHVFSRLYLKLSQRTGYGYTTYAGHAPQFLALQGRWFGLAYQKDDGTVSFGPPPARDRFGLVAVKAGGAGSTNSLLPGEFFDFVDLSAAPSHINAKRAIVYPSRRIQFQRADIYVAQTRVMHVQLYQINLLEAGSPLITEDWFGIMDNQLEVNYPYFLQLRPGFAELVRFHTGDISSRDGQGTSGAFMDYELDWNRGDDFDGMFELKDIATGQMEVDFRQFMRLDSRTTASAQFGVPLYSGYYGDLSVSHQFNGIDTSVNGSASQTFRGLDVRATDYSASAMTTPVRIKGSPFQYTYGVVASEATNSLIDATQVAYGPTATLRSLPIKLAPKVNLMTSLTVSELAGENVASGATVLGSATLTDQLARNLSVMLNYSYTHDGFNDKVLGAHQVSGTLNWNGGPLALNLFALRSLDLNRETLFADLDYKLSKQWRVRASYTYDEFMNAVDLDYTFAVTYHLGWREVGLIWSAVTKRFGIILLGATFN